MFVKCDVSLTKPVSGLSLILTFPISTTLKLAVASDDPLAAPDKPIRLVKLREMIDAPVEFPEIERRSESDKPAAELPAAIPETLLPSGVLVRFADASDDPAVERANALWIRMPADAFDDPLAVHTIWI